MKTIYSVYRLKSSSTPNQTYVGLTNDIDERLRKHNLGNVRHTSKYTAWQVENTFTFNTREKAAAFESYLKTGSGREFSRRHF